MSAFFPCPNCANPTAHTPVTEPSGQDYFLCQACGLIWMKPRDSDGPISIVAQPEHRKTDLD